MRAPATASSAAGTTANGSKALNTTSTDDASHATTRARVANASGPSTSHPRRWQISRSVRTFRGTGAQ